MIELIEGRICDVCVNRCRKLHDAIAKTVKEISNA